MTLRTRAEIREIDHRAFADVAAERDAMREVLTPPREHFAAGTMSVPELEAFIAHTERLIALRQDDITRLRLAVIEARYALRLATRRAVRRARRQARPEATP